MRRCDAPSFGRRPKPFSLKPDIMQGTRRTGRIEGEQNTGLENVLQTGRSVGCLRDAPAYEIQSIQIG